MTRYYSKATCGFYDDAIHGEDQIPADAAEITEAEHQALLSAQEQGKVIAADKKGRPVAIDRPALSPEVVLALVRVRRAELLAACDWTQVADVPLSDEARGVWRTYRQALRDLPENLPAGLTDPNAAPWPNPPV
jgi:hypothetical protein